MSSPFLEGHSRFLLMGMRRKRAAETIIREDYNFRGPCSLQKNPRNASGLLRAWSAGDEVALNALTPIVYNELRRPARRYLRREHAGHSLQTTALVNEAYMRLVDCKRMQWQNRAHFFAVSAQLMRRILVDHARS